LFEFDCISDFLHKIKWTGAAVYIVVANFLCSGYLPSTNALHRKEAKRKALSVHTITYYLFDDETGCNIAACYAIHQILWMRNYDLNLYVLPKFALIRHLMNYI